MSDSFDNAAFTTVVVSAGEMALPEVLVEMEKQCPFTHADLDFRNVWHQIAYLHQDNAQHVTKCFCLGDLDPNLGILDHVEQELRELRADPDDIDELGDVLGCLFHFALAKGYSEAQVCQAVLLKLQHRFYSPNWTHNIFQRASEVPAPVHPAQQLDVDAQLQQLRDAITLRTDGGSLLSGLEALAMLTEGAILGNPDAWRRWARDLLARFDALGFTLKSPT